MRSSADDEIEALRIGHLVGEVPPLLVVVRKPLGLHEEREEPPVGRYLARCIHRVGGGRKRIERRAHVEFLAIAANQGQVHGESQVMPAAARDIAIAKQVLLTRAFGPIDHRQRCPNWTIAIEHLEGDAFVARPSLNPGQGRCCLTTEERAVRLVPWKHRAGKVVGRRVPCIHHNRRLDEADIDQVSASGRIARDVDLRSVDRWGASRLSPGRGNSGWRCSRLVPGRWLHAGDGGDERGTKQKAETGLHARKGIARTEVAHRAAMSASHRPRVFLISPATAHGPRAMALRRPDAASVLARRLREEGAPLGEVFSFLSGLYFRGKLDYARAFARAADPRDGVHIITLTDGLVTPEVWITAADLERYALCIDGTAAAVATLEATAVALSERLGASADVVLLGSVSTGKYTDLLAPIFGERLLFPRDVLHIGQLARGALFLRQAREREELEYMPVSEIIRAGRRVSLRPAPPDRLAEAATPEIPSRATRPNTEDARADSRQ